MVNRTIFNKKTEFIHAHLARVAVYGRCSFKEFQLDQNVQDVIEYNLFQAINHLIALLEHIVVDEDYGLPQSASHAAEILALKRILTKKDAEMVRKMAGFRNVIAHEYIYLDKRIVYQVMIKGVKDIKRIVAKLTRRFKF